MIDRLLDSARGRVDNADALWRREEQTAVAFESGRLKAAGISEEAGINLRVLANGRMGVAGTTAAKPDPKELVERARASAGLGEIVQLAFPGATAAPSTTPAATFTPFTPVQDPTPPQGAAVPTLGSVGMLAFALGLTALAYLVLSKAAR